MADILTLNADEKDIGRVVAVVRQLVERFQPSEDVAAGAAIATTQVIAGAGLTGGGTLQADRTLAVGAGTGITVNADDVALANMAQATIKGRAGGAGTGSPQDLTPAQARTVIQDGAGRFKVRLTADMTSLTAATTNKVNYDTEDLDNDSWFDSATNHRFTPQLAGWYFIHHSARCNATGTANEGPQAYIYKNGSVHTAGTYGATGGSYIGEASALVQMNGSTDYIEGYFYIPAGQTVIKANANNTYLEGWFVGS